MKAVLLLLCVAGSACATVAPPGRTAPIALDSKPISKAPGELANQVREAVARPDALADPSFLRDLADSLDRFNGRLDRAARLWIGISYTAVFQYASASRGPQEAAGGDLGFFGGWDALNSDRWPGHVYFQTETRHRYTSIPPSDLGDGIGSLWGTTVDFDTQDFALVQLYWDHGSFEDGFRYRIGKVDPALIYDAGRYVGDSFAFLNAAFSDTLPMAVPAAGLGGAVGVYPHDRLYVLAGLHDANGRRTAGISSFFDQTEFFYVVEAGYTPRYGETGEGMYHLTAWYQDAQERDNTPSGKGIALTLEQEFGPQGTIVPFVRYAYGEGAGLDVRQLLAAGIGFEDLFGYSEDLLGIGLAWGQPADRALRDQYTFEIFYLLHITPQLKLTPDFQVIRDPSKNPDESVVYVAGVRVRLVF